MSEIVDRRIAFNAGEISPWLDPRIDMDKYRMACRTMQNMRGTIYGGAIRRSGTEYLGEALSASSQSRLVAFSVNSTTQYIVEFSNLKLRVWDTLTGLIAADNIVTPFLESEINAMQFSQQNDVMFIAHPDHPPMVLSRYPNSIFLLTTMEQSWPVLLDPNFTDTTIKVTSEATPATISIAIYSSSAAYSIGNKVKVVGTPTRYFSCIKKIDAPTSPLFAAFKAAYTSPLTGRSWKDYWVEMTLSDLTTNGIETGVTVTLISSSDIFDPSHVGTKWVITQRRDTLVVKLTLATVTAGAAAKVSTPLYVLGEWSVLIRATNNPTAEWSSYLIVEKSSDLVTWETHVPVKSGTSDVQQLLTGTEDEPCFLRLRHISTAGELPSGYVAELEASNPDHHGMVIIKTVLPAEQATAYATRSSTYNVITKLTVNQFGSCYAKVPTVTITGGGGTGATGTAEIDGLGRVIDVDITSGGSGYTSTPTVTLSAPDASYFAQAVVLTSLLNGDATTRWQAPAWNAVNGYPRAITLHDGRLWFGGTNAKPTTIWASTVDSYGEFRIGADADRSLAYTLQSDEASAVEWLVSQELLIIGTSSGEWVFGQKLGEDIAKLRRNTSFGSAAIQARAINDALVFVQRSKRKLREYAYAADKDGYNAVDLNMLAEHLGDATFKQMAIQRNPEAIVWIVTERGDLLALTYERGQAVTGWSRHVTDGSFESVAVVLGSGEDDQVWVTVKRTVNGVTARYVERFQPDTIRKIKDGNHAAAVYLDSAMTVTPVAKLCSGLSHLKGKTVSILADGMVHRDLVVSATGTLLLDANATSAIIGLPFESILEPTYLETMDPNSLSKLGKKRLTRAILEFWKTLGGEISSDGGDTWRPMQIRGDDSVLDTAAAPFTGLVEEYVESNTDRQVTVAIRQTQPLPLNVMSMNLRYRLEL